MKIKRIELALLLFMAVLMTCSVFTAFRQSELAEGVVRLRVVANDNDMIRQSQKLHVRDAGIESCKELLQDAGDASAVRERLYANTAIINDAVQRVVGNNGFCVKISESRYPTRRYQNFALPAGRYIGVQILLGEANGRNWWCVLYPSLCLSGDYVEDLRCDETAFSFKCMEWLSVLCEHLWE